MTKRPRRPAPRCAGMLCLGLALLPGLLSGCGGGGSEPEVLAEFPIDDLTGIVDRANIVFDAAQSSDGRGAARLDTRVPATVRLFETGDLDVEDATIVLEARLRTEGCAGRVYLEMLCGFAGRGEFFSRALDGALTGTTGWTTQKTPFLLRKGENPSNIRINLVTDGPGSIWIDQVRLTRSSAR